VRKEINAHGAGVVRLQKVNGRWQVVDNDPLNRRFTTASRMEFTGPLRGTDHVKTKYSPPAPTAAAPTTTAATATPVGHLPDLRRELAGHLRQQGHRPEDQRRMAWHLQRPIQVGNRCR
jgi:hypothetical protein